MIYGRDTVENYKNKLPYNFYEILIHQAEAKSYLSISADLSIPMGTVKSRLHRARKMISKLIDIDFPVYTIDLEPNTENA